MDGDINPHIEDWTIVVSGEDARLACSPDGLDLVNGVGYEFKTKSSVVLPSDVDKLLACEYLQCQTCLRFCEGFVHSWVICYNRLDTGEFKAYLITPDPQLMDAVMGELSAFADKIEELVEKLWDACSKDSHVQFEQFFEQHKYAPMKKAQKNEVMEQLKASMRAHVYPITIKVVK